MLAVTAVSFGCSPAPDRDDAQAGTVADRPVLELTPTMPTSPDPLDLDRIIAAARSDLAGRLAVEVGRIETVEARWVTWSNGAMGCPEPDMMYTQALVPGYRILLRIDGTVYAYHGARGGQPFYCPADRAGTPLPDESDLR